MSFGPETAPEALYFETGQNALDDEELLRAFIEFGEYLRAEPPEYRVEIVFTVESVTSQVSEGIVTFIESVDSTVPAAVIRVLPANGERPLKGEAAFIRTGSRNRLSPPWLLQDTIAALDSAGIPWVMETAFLSLFRIGWMADNPILDAFFTGDIPAIEVRLPSGESLPEGVKTSAFLKEQMRRYYPDRSREWDRHYSFFRLGSRYFFVHERILILLMILVTGITFFILFMFSFIFGIKQYDYRNDFKRTWYLIPVIFLINCLSLYLGQELTFRFFSVRYGTADGWRQYPYLAFALKGAITYLIFTLVMLIQRFFRFPRDSYIYGFLVNITCLMNILVFTIMDFSLVILFVAEYILSLLFSKVRSFVSILLVGTAMLIPFLFFGNEALRAGNIYALESLFAGSLAENAAISFILIPIELFIIRLLVKTGRFGRKRIVRVPVFPVLFIGISAALVTALFMLPQFTERSPQQIAVSEQRITSVNMQTEANIFLVIPVPGGRTLQVAAGENRTEMTADMHMKVPVPAEDISGGERRLSVTTSENSFLDRKRVALEINSELIPLRINVTVYREAGYAIFDANYPFIVRGTGNIGEFTLEEKPPLPLTIEFTTEGEADIYVSVVLHSLENPDRVLVTAVEGEDTVKQDFLYKEERLFHFPGRETADIR
ncbi:MAG: hypothetical protein LBR47_05170 [Spirochaetaceae bacterium]|nr:hypothetical protein [Spirochaetaceae bacterium]